MHLSTINNTENKLHMYPFHSTPTGTPHRYPSAPPTIIRKPCVPGAAAKSLQSCATLCDPRDGSPPGSPVPGILQARTLEWVAISFSNAWKWNVKVKLFSCVWLFTTPWTAAYQAPPSMGFSRQEYWSGVPLPSPVSGAGLQNTRVYIGMSELGKEPFKWGPPK